MDFMKGAKAKGRDWITVLCWAMGDQLCGMVEDHAEETGETFDGPAGELSKLADQAGETVKAKDEGSEAAITQPKTDQLEGGQPTKHPSAHKRMRALPPRAQYRTATPRRALS
jgi:predicted NUDIX family NTP pyrophosphohydrolase